MNKFINSKDRKIFMIGKNVFLKNQGPAVYNGNNFKFILKKKNTETLE